MQKGQAEGTIRKNLKTRYRYDSILQTLKDLLWRGCGNRPARSRGHHEKWDGTGYPRGLKGELIPLAARIFAVVDVWDALSSDRPYRPAWPPEKVRAYLKDEAGRHFDPRVVDVFLKILAEEGE